MPDFQIGDLILPAFKREKRRRGQVLHGPNSYSANPNDGKHTPGDPAIVQHVRVVGSTINRTGFDCPNPTRPGFPPATPDPPCDSMSTPISFSLSGTQTAVGTHATTVITYSGNHISVTNHTDSDPGGSGVTTTFFSATDITIPTGFGVCVTLLSTTSQTGYQPFPTWDFQTGFRDVGGGAGLTPGNIIHQTSPSGLVPPNPQPQRYNLQGICPPAGPSVWKYVTELQTVLSYPDPSTTFDFEADLSLTLFSCDQDFSHPLNNLLEVFTLPSPSAWMVAEFCGAQLNPVSGGWDVLFNDTGDCYIRWLVIDANALTTGFGCETPRLNYNYTISGADPTGVDINTAVTSLNQITGHYPLWTENPTGTTGSTTDTTPTNYHPWANNAGRIFCPEFLVGFSGSTPGTSRTVQIRNPVLKGWTTT